MRNEAFIRRDSRIYLGLEPKPDEILDLSGFVSSKETMPFPELAIIAGFNLRGDYSIDNGKEYIIKPLLRDWFMEVLSQKERDRMIKSKTESIPNTQINAVQLNFSTDPSLTAKLFEDLER